MSNGDITALLEQARHGDRTAADRLFTLIYDELKRIASYQRSRWRGNETLNATALLNEAFIKLAGQHAAWSNRTHFYATASKAMRHILVNYAEQQKASKRGGDALRVTLESLELITETPAEELLTLHQALAELEADHPRRAQVVECRVFGGMSVEETAGALDISTATVKREWRVSSTWLYRALRDADDGRAPTSP